MAIAARKSNVTKVRPVHGRHDEFERLCNVVRRHDLRTLAKSAGVAQSTLWYWVEGVTQAPRLTTLAKVAKAVGFRIKLVKSK